MHPTAPTLDHPPRDAATVVMLRDGAAGLEVLLMRRHTDSAVLGGAYVFPGGKVDPADSARDLLARLDHPCAELHPLLGEPSQSVDAAASFFVAAAREAFEESGVLYASRAGQPLATDQQHTAFDAIGAGQSFADMLAGHQLRLDTALLAPWSRWVTPRQPTMMNRRFDTRFFLAVVPHEQEARVDDFEVTEARWLTPRAAIGQYLAREIDMAAPQIVSLLHLGRYANAAEALADARTRRPPLIEPASFEEDGARIVCYPGDPRHPVREAAFPAHVPTRLAWREKRFDAPRGLANYL